MFVRYLKVFHEHHTQHLTRLSVKTKLIVGIINEDIMIKQLNPSGTSETISKKKSVTESESISKYIGNVDEINRPTGLTEDSVSNRKIYSTSSNSTISSNKYDENN